MSSTRFTKTDLEIINSALALLEVDERYEEPDPCGYDFDDPGDARRFERDLAAWRSRVVPLRRVRVKVHARRG